MEYPYLHRQIVNDLLKGKFILYSDFDKFQSLEKSQDYYSVFFEKTFGYELILKKEYAYLASDKTDETLSRNFTIFLSVLCYEISQRSDDFKKRIENDTFYYKETLNLLKNQKAYQDVIKESGILRLDKFLKTLYRRNIIQFVNKADMSFRFTKSVDLFFDFAMQLAKEQQETADMTTN